MVSLYVAGQKVGTLADAETLIPELIARRERVELRDDAGNSLGTLDPAPAPDELLVPWDPTVTQADVDRVLAEPGVTFEEAKKLLGWE